MRRGWHPPELASFGIDAVIVEPGHYPTGIEHKRVLPADTTRLAPYGPALDHYHAAREAAGAASQAGDPQEVADAIAALITMPADQRPLRTVVAPTEMERQEAQAINKAVAEVQQSFLSAFGLEALVAP